MSHLKLNYRKEEKNVLQPNNLHMGRSLLASIPEPLNIYRSIMAILSSPCGIPSLAVAYFYKSVHETN